MDSASESYDSKIASLELSLSEAKKEIAELKKRMIKILLPVSALLLSEDGFRHSFLSPEIKKELEESRVEFLQALPPSTNEEKI